MVPLPMKVFGGPDPLLMGIELIYSIVVVFLCFFIYFKTREIYQLTKHRGIGFFRNAFIFFAIAYSSRLIFAVVQITKMALEIRGPVRLFMLGLPITAYAGSFAILLLVFSSISRNIKAKTSTIYIFINIVSITITIGVFIFGTPWFLALLHTILFISAIVFGYLNQKKKGKSKFSRLYVIYALLFLFWNLNMFIFSLRMHMHETRAPLYLISLGLFTFITHKVIHKLK